MSSKTFMRRYVRYWVIVPMDHEVGNETDAAKDIAFMRKSIADGIGMGTKHRGVSLSVRDEDITVQVDRVVSEETVERE